MNKKQLALLAAGVVIACGAVFSVAFASRGADNSGDCSGTGKSHTVVIENDHMNPTTTQASRCDTLTIVNRDNITREIGFGEHEHHTAYDGVTERLLGKDDSFTITLVQTGTHGFHDHFHDEVAGSFTVK